MVTFAATPTQLWACTATELTALYRSGNASPVDATTQILDRIDQLNPTVNAYCLVDRPAALLAAKASEIRWKAGLPLSEIDGVPTSIKDLILTSGWPTLRGSRTVNADQAWDVDAPCVARLKEAGAVLVGKTATPEFGCKGETNSPRLSPIMTGNTRNPWNLSKTPGGSSGGAAAAIAASLGPLAMGTDGAGSVRIPAAFCGNFGLKPSFGRVPAYPLSPFGSVAHLGPHTLSVSDAAHMMNVIGKPDARDWTSLAPSTTDYTAQLFDGIKGWRIAYSPTLGYVTNVDPEVAKAVDDAVKVLQSLGAHVDCIDPGFTSPFEISAGLWFAGSATLWAGLSKEQRDVCDPDFAAQAEIGNRLSMLDMQQLHMRRGLLGSHMRQFMQNYDILITPTVSIPAFDARPAGSVPFNAEEFLAWTPFSYPFNLTQQPAATIPCGLTRDGLPIGLQLVGRMFEDHRVLQAARAYEQTRPIDRAPI